MKSIANIILKINTLSLMSILVLGSYEANAARYIVVMKDQKAFVNADQQFRLSNRMKLSSLRLSGVQGRVIAPFQNTDADIESSLENVQTIIINTDNERDLDVLANSSLVASVEKEKFYKMPKPVLGFTLTKAWSFDARYIRHGHNNGRTVALGQNTPWGIQAVKAPQAWEKGNYGTGVKVLVLDTGVDKDHPALKDNFLTGKNFFPVPAKPYAYADDEGHGTHCSGTIGASLASDGFVGVAPKVSLLMGRVCGTMVDPASGEAVNGCSNASIVQGIDYGIAQKVDVISMSLGGPTGSPAEAQAMQRAEKAGIAVVAASGNSNDEYPGEVGFPAAYPTVIAVGAINSKIQKADFSQYGPELDIVAPGVDVRSSVPMGTGRDSFIVLTVNGVEQSVKSSAFSGTPVFESAVSNELVYGGLGKPEEIPDSVRGKFALIVRGDLTFVEKVKNAIDKGAAGVVIYNHSDGLMSGTASEDGSVKIPVVMIEKSVGEQLKAKLDSHISVAASVKTVPADYSNFDGTSMATPHVAGVVALMKAANKALKPAKILEILKMTTQSLPSPNNEMGAGLVDAEKAVTKAKEISTVDLH